MGDWHRRVPVPILKTGALCINANIGTGADSRSESHQSPFGDYLDFTNGLPIAFGATDLAIKPASTITVTTYGII